MASRNTVTGRQQHMPKEAYPVDSGFSRCSVPSDPIGTVARADTDGKGAVARGIPEVVSRRSAFFSLLKRWALGTYHGLRRQHVDTYLNEFVFRYNRRFYRHVYSKRCSGSPPTTSPSAIGTSSSETIFAKAPAGPTRPAYYI